MPPTAASQKRLFAQSTHQPVNFEALHHELRKLTTMQIRETRMLAGQVLVAGFGGAVAPEPLVRWCADGELGGIILFRRNLGSVHDVASLIARFTDAAPTDRPLLVSVDQEGGRVARLGDPVLRLPPMRVLGAINDPILTERAGVILGRQLSALGFNMDFAPVLDVDSNPENPVIGDRSFGTSPERVIAHGLAFARGLAQGGVLSCGKHFPGHGDTDLDSHLALPLLGHPRERLDAIELAPFRAAAEAKLPAIMTAHVVFQALAQGTPATLARQVVTTLLREELDFSGVVVSDDLEMRAIADHYGVEQAACLSIEAGCDALLICSKPEWVERAKSALAERAASDAGFRARLEDAASRFVKLRAQCVARPETDPERLVQRLDAEAAGALTREIDARRAQLDAP